MRGIIESRDSEEMRRMKSEKADPTSKI